MVQKSCSIEGVSVCVTYFLHRLVHPLRLVVEVSQNNTGLHGEAGNGKPEHYTQRTYSSDWDKSVPERLIVSHQLEISQDTVKFKHTELTLPSTGLS